MPDLSTARIGVLPAVITTRAVTLTPATPRARFILRGVDAVTAAGTAFGVAIPTKPLTSARQGDHAALWLGPDEWLLQAPAAETTALQGLACALVDISHRQTGLIVKGPKAASLLNAGVPLDLSLAAFPSGMVTRTIFEKAEIVLWRLDAETFHVEVWRSFAPYLLALLEAADHGVA